MVVYGLVSVAVLDMVRCVHELWVLVNMVWSVGLIQVMVLLSVFGVGMESLVMAVLVRLELLHPCLCLISVLVMVRFVQRVCLLVQVSMCLDMHIFVMSVSNRVMHGMTDVFLVSSMMSINMVIIFVENFSVVINVVGVMVRS